MVDERGELVFITKTKYETKKKRKGTKKGGWIPKPWQTSRLYVWGQPENKKELCVLRRERVSLRNLPMVIGRS